MHLFSRVVVCGVQLTCQRASLGKKTQSPDLKGIVARYTLRFCGPTQDRSTWGLAAGDSYRLDTRTGQPLPRALRLVKLIEDNIASV